MSVTNKKQSLNKVLHLRYNDHPRLISFQTRERVNHFNILVHPVELKHPFDRIKMDLGESKQITLP